MLPVDDGALDASVCAGPAGLLGTGVITGLAPGASDSTTITVGLDTGNTGAKTGSIGLVFTADAGGGNVTTLPAGSVAVSGAVYREASASVSPLTLTVHVGDVGHAALTVANTDFASRSTTMRRPRLEQLSGPGTLVRSGTAFTLDLGTVAQGGTPITVALGALNAASGPADLLSGSFAATGLSAFSLQGLGGLSGIAAGQADTAPVVTLSTGTAGQFSEPSRYRPPGRTSAVTRPRSRRRR